MPFGNALRHSGPAGVAEGRISGRRAGFRQPENRRCARRPAAAAAVLRFLGLEATDPTGPTEIHLVLNWFEELKARVPVR